MHQIRVTICGLPPKPDGLVGLLTADLGASLTNAARTQKSDPKAALYRCKLIAHLEGALEFEAQTRAGRVTNAVAPDIDTQVAQTIA
jgi:hypothetical protein